MSDRNNDDNTNESNNNCNNNSNNSDNNEKNKISVNISSINEDTGESLLHDAIRERNIPDILKIIEEQPNTVQHKNKYDQYPLHLACLLLDSDQIVAKLLQLYPRQFYCYPLHVMNLLLSTFPVELAVFCMNQKKQYPWHIACDDKFSEKLLRRLINFFPEAIEKYDEFQRYPLHYACCNTSSCNISLKVFQTLFPYHAKGIGFPLKSKTNETPLSYLLTYARFQLARELPICQLHIQQKWKKINVFALHLIDAYPNQTLCKNFDERYPLHTACQVGVDEKIILCLLNINLLAVKHKCDQGKYPLDYAKQHNLKTISNVLEDLMKKDNDELENRVGIPSIVTSHDINQVTVKVHTLKQNRYPSQPLLVLQLTMRIIEH